MIRSNIPGLSKLLNEFDTRIKAIEGKRKSKIRGGPNTLVSEVGNDIIISSQGGGESTNIDTPYYPWRLYTATIDGTRHIRCKGGLINGVLPENINENIGSGIAKDDDDSRYVYIEVTFSGSSITEAKLEMSKVESAPSLELDFVKGAPPDKFRHLIGLIANQRIADQYLRKHLLVKPAIAYRNQDESDPDIIENYFCWDVYPL